MNIHISFSLAIALTVVCPVSGQTVTGSVPTYTADGVVNGATQLGGPLAPNAIATIYGSSLSFTTHATGASDIVGGKLPQQLDGVSVLMNGLSCGLLLVSPGQINLVVPYQLTAGSVAMIVVRQNVDGPEVTIQIGDVSPGLFAWSGNIAIATHLNGQLLTPTNPGLPGETIVLYAGGLGRTSPDTTSGKIATSASPIAAMASAQLVLGGTPCPPGTVLYAGLAPGFSGLYQINVRLPASFPPNPVIQVAVSSTASPANLVLPTGGAVASVLPLQ